MIYNLQTVEEVKAEIEKGKLQDIEDYKKSVMQRVIQIQNVLIRSRGKSATMYYNSYTEEFMNDVEEILQKEGFVIKTEMEADGTPYKVCCLP